MKFMISHLNFYEDDGKQEKINMFRIIKFCFHMILIDQFLLSTKINCAESSDFVLIEKEVKNLMHTDRSETLNKITDKSTSAINKPKKTENTSDEPKSKLKDESVPSTNETNKSLSNSPLFEFNMFTLEYNLKSLLDYTIPDVIKDFDEDKDIQNKVFDLIKEIKSKVKSYDEDLVEKIEKKMIRKQNVNFKFNEIIESYEKESKELLLEFEKIKKQFYEAKTSQSSILLPDLDDYLEFKFSEVNSKREQLFKGLLFSKLTFFKEKNYMSLILMVLNKVLELTPKEFKGDEEVSKAILSLD